MFKIESFMYLGYCFKLEFTEKRTAEPNLRHITGLVIFTSLVAAVIYNSLLFLLV